MALKDLPSDAQPREKLLARGPGALSDAELLALLLRTGMAGKGVLQLAAELLAAPPTGFGGISGLLNTSADDLNRIKGLGPATTRNSDCLLSSRSTGPFGTTLFGTCRTSECVHIRCSHGHGQTALSSRLHGVRSRS